ncbi:PilW family protein [Luteimonas sp. NJZ50]|nr:prepilin-type N-terminal cleavage/methylation domain-containing protein [Lysobacter sedimenti]
MSPSRSRVRGGTRAGQRGVTLIELMVALVLGLIVTGAALALFATNRKTYVAAENLDRIQESSRTAFELMARDLREADGNPCSNELAYDGTNPGTNGTFRNVLKGASTPYAWWSNWGNGAGLRGYTGAQAFADDGFGTAPLKRVAGTPAVELWTATPTDGVLKAAMVNTTDDLVVSDTSGIAANDILVICDYGHGTIFQASSVGADTIEHHAGGTPGNIDGTLPPDIYKPNSVISRLHAVRWYIGYNGRTDADGNLTRSLYRTGASGPDAKPAPDEIVEDVTGMTLKYHVKGGATYDDVPANWKDVDAVQIRLTMAGRDKVGTDSKVFTRNYDYVVAIRSRAQ